MADTNDVDVKRETDKPEEKDTSFNAYELLSESRNQIAFAEPTPEADPFGLGDITIGKSKPADKLPQGKEQILEDGSKLVTYKEIGVTVHFNTANLPDQVTDKNGIRRISYTQDPNSQEILMRGIRCFNNERQLVGSFTKVNDIRTPDNTGKIQNAAIWKDGEEVISGGGPPIPLSVKVDNYGNIHFTNVRNPEKSMVLKVNGPTKNIEGRRNLPVLEPENVTPNPGAGAPDSPPDIPPDRPPPTRKRVRL
jgi:hypothetical protein